MEVHAEPEHLQYSEASAFNTVDIFLAQPSYDGDEAPKIWVVYIHGGGWRDPEVTANSFKPALRYLLKDPVSSRLSGLASIDYRLSPHVKHPTKPSSPEDPARNAKHPQHILDVLDALRFLQKEYGFGSNYILVGHSVGATLAFQVASGRWDAGRQVAPPIALVGISGIYDIPKLIHDYRGIPIYKEFVEGALGDSPEQWAAASPVNLVNCPTWTDPRLIVIAHSANDGLVNDQQPENMLEALKKDMTKRHGDLDERRVVYLPVDGEHDDLWEKGAEVAGCIAEAIKLL